MKPMVHRRIIKIGIALVIILIILLLYLLLISITTPIANTWAMQTTQIDKLHELGFYGSGVVIGIVDTGIDTTHQEFDQSTFKTCIDTINGRTSCYDDGDHGTHIAGILTSKESLQGILTGIKLQGIAPKAKIISAKAVPNDQFEYDSGNDTAIAQAIQFCIDNNADIILLSLGKNPEKIQLDDNSMTAMVIQQALHQGIFVIAPAGNDGNMDDGDVAFPGSIDQVICVGSIGKNDIISSFSSAGHQYPQTLHPNKKPELIAPGEQILSTRTNGAYGEISGTSQAATYVTGILALLLDAYPEYKHGDALNQQEITITQFKTVFMETAKKIGNLQQNNDSNSHDDLYGYGLIQAYDAYKALATQ
jgi:subtilisin family serine protease